MNKEFIPYEQALELKELGFDQPCFGWFRTTLLPSNFTEYFLETELSLNEEFTDLINSNFTGGACSAPLYQQAFRWFREKYNIDGFVRIEPLNEKYGFVIYNREKGNFKEFYADYNSVEEAELACLNRLIEIVKVK